MAAAHFGDLSSFDHNTRDWMAFKNRLNQWFVDNDLSHIDDKAGIKRRAILLTTFSETTYKLASDLVLPNRLEDTDFESILDILDKYFIPKRCGFAERFKFYAAVQRKEEGHGQWAARLRGLAAYCGFNNLEESLLDRFVMGMLSGPERDKLFVQDIKELTLAKAVELAESVRYARAAASVVPSAPASEGAEFKVAEENPAGERCTVCGLMDY